MTENIEKPTADAVLASFEQRFIAFALDLIILFTFLVVTSPLLQQVDPPHAIWITLGLILLYFSLPTASGLRATLGKLMAGLRVVDYAGNTLSLWRAALRSSVLAALAVGAMTIGSCAMDSRLCVIGIGSILLVLLPAFTPRRQGVQDIVAGSIVVGKDTLQRRDARECIRGAAGKAATRPSVLNVVGNAALIAVPAYLLFQVGLVQEDMNLRHRTGYAFSETGKLRSLVEEYYLLEGTFPRDAAALGVAAQTPYPDGGYYRLEDNGAIRIGFTVLPALRNGSITLEPSSDENGVIHWDCIVHGDLARKYLPPSCRE